MRDPEATLLAMSERLNAEYRTLVQIAEDVPSDERANLLYAALADLENAAARIRTGRALMIEMRGGIDRAHRMAAE